MKKLAAVVTVVFYALIVFLGIILLAAAQLRSAGGATFDTWRLNYESTRIRVAELRKTIREITDKARLDANSQRLNELCLRLYDRNGLPNGQVIDEHTMLTAQEARRNRTPHDHPSLSLDAGCLVKGYSMLQNDIKYFGGLVAESAAELDDLKKSLTSNNEQHAELIKGHQDFLTFKEMEALWYQRLFIVLPYDLLVLLLVMFMGALGGMVRLLRDYGAADRSNPSTTEYFFVPLIGIVVAIGGYVLAKTGLLLLSSARGESSLSPFMISLVGIVSGLLAKDVIDTIAARGRTLFQRQDEAARAQEGAKSQAG